jgi:transposase
MMVAHPDEVITHCPEASCCCSCGLNDWEELAQEVAQVIDIPPIKAKVTEHRKVGFQGRKCGDVFRENFPTGDMGVNRLQYGANIQSLAVYFNHYHFIPYHRLSEMFSDCFGISLSVGSLVNFMKRAQVSLVLFEEGIKQALLSSPVLHRDETGMRSEGKTIWVHTVSNEHLTYYQLDQHRWTQAMDRGGILPEYTGYRVHDRYASYV